jgi:hypothetical protein
MAEALVAYERSSIGSSILELISLNGSLVCRELCAFKLYPKIANYMETVRNYKFTFAEKSHRP